MSTNESILLKDRNCHMLNNYCFKEDNCNLLEKIVHEINNSFTFIDSSIQLIESHNSTINEIENWNQLSKDVKEFSSFLHDFSTYSLSNQLNLTETNLVELITEIIDGSTEITTQNDIELLLSFGDISNRCLTRYRCDNHQLKLAISNLTDWLIDNVSTGSKIHIQMPSAHEGYYTHTDDNQYMKIQFSTDGLHMSSEELENLFTPVTPKGTIYTDLTMPITHRIIYAHKGGISINKSNANNTTFTVFLPTLTSPSLFLVPKLE